MSYLKILNCCYSRLETLITTSSKMPGLLFRRNLVGFFIDDINPNSVFLIIFYVMLCHCCYDLSAIQIVNSKLHIPVNLPPIPICTLPFISVRISH